MSKAIHVLLIDDDPDDSFLFKEALKRIEQAIDYSYCDGGISALKFLANHSNLPDYIFLDMNMPRMNGLEVLTELKNDIALKHIPVIIYSTSANEDHQSEARRLGASLYVTKPYQVAELKKAILMVFETIPRLA
jgi:CheY-like chemotaxis protein